VCGIIGVVTSQGRRPSVDERTLETMRDRLAHRGPDEAGLRLTGNVGFGHRRLSILDPEHGQQPLSLAGTDGSERFLLTFNGEIYNHLELRRELERQGASFATSCDTETLLRQLVQQGAGGIAELRGMYAFGFIDLLEQRLLLARDPLGVKPLYYAFVSVGGGKELVFASEPTAILAHPAVSATPDWATASAYLSTIRTTLGDRSLFAGISVLQPGQYLLCDLTDPDLGYSVESHWREPEEPADLLDYGEAVGQARRLLTESVEAHLISDVPVCALLSGGLDSTILATLAKPHIGDLRTYCAGAVRDQASEDFAHAAEAAERLGSKHTEVPITRGLFLERWPWMVQRLGVPLSTPNEVAIHAVAKALSADAKVTISGEGADELFAGYEPPLLAALQYLRHPFDDEGEAMSPAESFLRTVSWIPRAMKSVILQEPIHEQTEDDAVLERVAQRLFADAGDGRHSLEAHLRIQRRFNLTGLLGRLDTATMLASVEGRTPFADRVVADFAARLPMGFKFQHQAESGETRSKRILRDAFGSVVPASIRERPKASFPLPFQSWLAEAAEVLRRGPASEVFTDAVRQMLLADANQHWILAWPILNLSLWLERWWGNGRPALV
jgi:asparagine synthase (glutamine-hydrolysing)